jgi:hypothetical protein
METRAAASFVANEIIKRRLRAALGAERRLLEAVLIHKQRARLSRLLIPGSSPRSAALLGSQRAYGSRTRFQRGGRWQILERDISPWRTVITPMRYLRPNQAVQPIMGLRGSLLFFRSKTRAVAAARLRNCIVLLTATLQTQLSTDVPEPARQPGPPHA